MPEIRDEPTVEQTNAQMDTWLAGVAFNALFREQNPEKAKRRLGQMSDEKLELLVKTCKELTTLAEGVYMGRARKKGGAE